METFKKVLLLGSSGFIGTNFLEVASELDWREKIITPTRAELDLRCAERVEKYLSSLQPDIIINLAGVVGGIKRNIEAPFSLVSDNSRISLSVSNFLARCKYPVTYITLGSSCMFPARCDSNQAFGPKDLMSGPVESTSEGYASAKYLALNLMRTAAAENGKLSNIYLIPATCYGPHDHFDPDKSHVVGALMAKISRAIERKDPFIDLLGDGSAIRQFTFVRDLCALVVDVIRLERFPIGTTVLTCPSMNSITSIADLAKLLISLMGYRGQIRWTGAMGGSSRKVLSSDDMTNIDLACPTSLFEGLKFTHQWMGEKFVTREVR